MVYVARGFRLNASVLLITAALVSGCAVGPDYHGAPKVAAGSTDAPSFLRAPAEGVSNSPTVAKWWEALNDAELNKLIDSALTQSPDIRAAQARLKQSRAGLRQQKRSALPSGSANAAYLHASVPSSTSDIGDLDFYNIGFDATWEADLFGSKRRAIEAAAAEAQAAQANLADAHVQLAAEVAQAYIDLRDQQQRLALVRRSVEVEDRVLMLTEQRREREVASDLEVERVRTQAENTRAGLIPLDAQILQSLDQLAVLTGREPGALDAELTAAIPLPALPQTVAIADPATLIRQRPDIRAAERNVAQKNAVIGQRVADYFPKLTLIGFVGFSGSEVSDLTKSDNLMWLGAPLLQWNALDFGRTHAKVEQAKGGLEEAEAKYESAVLRALGDANGALSRYGHQRDSVVSLRNVERSASRSAELTEQRYRAGTTSALEWLDAERTRFSAEQNRIAADAQLIKDYISLQKSLGLGWQPPAS